MTDEMIAIIVEGAAEEAILQVLIENDLLKFPIEKIYMEKVIRVRSSRNFQRSYLNQGLGDSKLVIYRILDSKKENFTLTKPYQRKVERIVELYTRPEIEMLFIIYNGDFHKYTSRFKSKIKPSDYVRQNYRDVKNPKSKADVYNFWSRRPNELVETIKKFTQLSSDKFDETISSILK
ncbi:N-6 DNA methylase [Weissella paramesenteroides]|uniref:N-6 DNA methylase n=1 Tax=Weissella paramesenteroides TaxID=1249 RepID=UPI00123C0E75|nr:N-6 DNA methylase [Weissella paramesenteroides]KAA8455257.1 N-6 DNA methylase [Weissella paramesenteroides]KAA8456282.1 N-6 DNA methylase [Weissella paramesenteroides]KAA8458227.1 N-6 DNA methylase [Weissella paramesenteroides]KAA8460218.1 N-6 DNA methylase [Weissella paramesenteroides]KAA8461560.1 N-6 DNA methylase [Weissella paramesenteroides]